MAAGAKGEDIWRELRILHAENIYAILDPQARGSVDVRSAVEELISGRLVSSLDVANAVVGAATQHAQALGFADISRIPRAAFIKAVLEVPPEWLSLSYGGTVPAVRSHSHLANMSTSAGDASWHVQPKRMGGGGRAAASEFPWGEDQADLDGLRQSLAQARQLGLELVSKINFAGAGPASGGTRRRPAPHAAAPRAARSTASSRNTSAPGRFAAKYGDPESLLEDSGLISALDRVANNESRAESWRAKEARSTARKVEKAREALRLAERDGMEAARRIEEAQARLRMQEKNGWKCALRTEMQEKEEVEDEGGDQQQLGSWRDDVDAFSAAASSASSKTLHTAQTARPPNNRRTAPRKSSGLASSRSAWSESSRDEDEEWEEAETRSPSRPRKERSQTPKRSNSPNIVRRSSSSSARVGSPSPAGGASPRHAAAKAASQSSVADRVHHAQRSAPRSWDDYQSARARKDQDSREAMTRAKKLREERKNDPLSFQKSRKFQPANSSSFSNFTGIERFNHLGFANSLRSDGMSIDDWASKKAPPSFRTPVVFEPFGEPGLDDEIEQRPQPTTPRLATPSASRGPSPRTRSASPATPRSRSVSFASQLRTSNQGRGAARAAGKGGRAQGVRQPQRGHWTMDFSDQQKDKPVLLSARLYSA